MEKKRGKEKKEGGKRRSGVGAKAASLEEGQPTEKEQAGEEEIHLPQLREGDGGHT